MLRLCLIKLVRRLWQLWKALWRTSRLMDNLEWTEGDRAGLVEFFTTGTGRKLEAALNTHVAIESQRVVLNGNDKFEAGTVAGMKLLLVQIQQLTQAGVAPQEDEQ